MATQSQNKDKEWMGIILYEHKIGCSTLTTAVLESANDQLRTMFSDHLNKYFTLQKQCFDTMSSNGWYQVPQAQQQELTRLQNTMTQMQTQLQQQMQ